MSCSYTFDRTSRRYSVAGLHDFGDPSSFSMPNCGAVSLMRTSLRIARRRQV
jgi:hypothetical protein